MWIKWQWIWLSKYLCRECQDLWISHATDIVTSYLWFSSVLLRIWHGDFQNVSEKALTVGEDLLLFTSTLAFFSCWSHPFWLGEMKSQSILICLSIIAKSDEQYILSQSSNQKTRWQIGLRNKNQETHLNAKHIYILN